MAKEHRISVRVGSGHTSVQAIATALVADDEPAWLCEHGVGVEPK